MANSTYFIINNYLINQFAPVRYSFEFTSAYRIVNTKQYFLSTLLIL